MKRLYLVAFVVMFVAQSCLITGCTFHLHVAERHYHTSQEHEQHPDEGLIVIEGE